MFSYSLSALVQLIITNIYLSVNMRSQYQAHNPEKMTGGHQASAFLYFLIFPTTRVYTKIEISQ